MSEENQTKEPTIEELKAQLAAKDEEIGKLKAAPAPKPEDPDLLDKAKKIREASEHDSDKAKRLEGAIEFNMKSKDFVKDNASLLPADVAEIFAQADKEKFDGHAEKASAIKSGVIQSFFNVQANVDMLTQGQKVQLDDFLKLTKNGKQEKAQQFYEMIFEPTFEMLKKIKKAEQLNRDRHGLGNPDDKEKAYIERIHGYGRKKFLGEKQNGT